MSEELVRKHFCKAICKWRHPCVETCIESFDFEAIAQAARAFVHEEIELEMHEVEAELRKAQSGEQKPKGKATVVQGEVRDGLGYSLVVTGEVCGTCGGSRYIRDSLDFCPDCNGTGRAPVEKDAEKKCIETKDERKETSDQHN